MKPTKYLLAALILAALGAAPVCAQKIKVGYWTSGFSLGFGTVLEQMKFAEQEGLQVEWVKFGEVNGPTRAIVSKAIDLAFAAPPNNSSGSAAGGATHALTTAILERNFGIRSNEYAVAPGNEAQLAQFLTQKDIDAGVLRSGTLAQMSDG